MIRLPISREEIQVELDRRRPGQSRITTQRREADEVEILSGVEDGLTTGTSLALCPWEGGLASDNGLLGYPFSRTRPGRQLSRGVH